MKFASTILAVFAAVSMVHALALPGVHHVQRRDPPELHVRGTGVRQILNRGEQ